jgi:hypothetical protein
MYIFISHCVRNEDCKNVKNAKKRLIKPTLSRCSERKNRGSSQGAQSEVYTLHSPLDAIQQR